MKIIKWIGIWVMLFIGLHSMGQERRLVDSLQHRLSEQLADTTKAEVLYSLSRAYWGNNPDSVVGYANQTVLFSEQIGYKKGIGNGYNSLGAAYFDKGEFARALEYYQQSLAIRIEIDDQKGLGSSYNNIGNIYNQLGNYPEALRNYYASMKIREANNDKQGMAMSYNNIGIVNKFQGNTKEALSNYFKTLKIEQELGSAVGIAKCYNNIGLLYYEQGDDDKALRFYRASLRLKEKANDRNGMVTSYENIANIYRNKGRYGEALNFNQRAMRLAQEIGYKNGISVAIGNIGVIYAKQKKYADAETYLNRALVMAKEIGGLDRIRELYKALVDLYTEQGLSKQAFDYYKLLIATQDSLLNTENTKKTMQLQLQYEFDRKEAAAQAAQEKKNTVQRFTRNTLIVGLVVMLLFALVFLRQRNKIAKGKKESDGLLLNILPEEIAEELKQTGVAIARQYNHVTVLFTDFVNFTGYSEQMSPTELVSEIHKNFTAFDAIIERNGLEKIKTIGDAYLAVCGLPNETDDHAQKVARAALDIRDYLPKYPGKFEVRIGIHSGPVVAGIVGVKKYAYDIWGDTVNTASRMESTSEAGKINISAATYELIKGEFTCTYRGKINAKNKGEVDMYFLEKLIS